LTSLNQVYAPKYVFCGLPQTEFISSLGSLLLPGGWNKPQIAPEFKLHFCQYRSQPASVLSSRIIPVASRLASASNDKNPAPAVNASAAGPGSLVRLTLPINQEVIE
jgi:hypothetical protein